MWGSKVMYIFNPNRPLGLHVKYTLFLPNLTELEFSHIRFRKILKRQISWKSFQWGSELLHADRHDKTNRLFEIFRKHQKRSRWTRPLLSCIMQMLLPVYFKWCPEIFNASAVRKRSVTTCVVLTEYKYKGNLLRPPSTPKGYVNLGKFVTSSPTKGCCPLIIHVFPSLSVVLWSVAAGPVT